MLTALWAPYGLDFRFEARTSREVFQKKVTYFVRVWDTQRPEIAGIGECALFCGLSSDDCPDYVQHLKDACTDPEAAAVSQYSSIRMGFETALADLHSGGRHCPADNAWTAGCEGIAINGLIWMGDKATMRKRIAEKLEQGFKVLKLKIGGIDFDSELDLLREIRRNFTFGELELRLDANGSFSRRPEQAMDYLYRLAEFGIHSIEQPLIAGSGDAMARICRESPIPVALDEELIGPAPSPEAASDLLAYLRPSYIILKPTLCGGFSGADTWIEQAGRLGMEWWATSALESNVGLNAIAQWLSAKHTKLPQGLGTGQLYKNNIQSPLELRGDRLFYNPSKQWIFPQKTEWRQ